MRTCRAWIAALAVTALAAGGGTDLSTDEGTGAAIGPVHLDPVDEAPTADDDRNGVPCDLPLPAAIVADMRRGGTG